MEMDLGFLWSDIDPTLLNAVLDQKTRLICWAISIVRHLESLYRLKGEVVRLSVQEIINIIPRRMINKSNGDLVDLKGLAKFLLTHGTVVEEDCPFTGIVDRAKKDPTPNVRRYRPTLLTRQSYNDWSGEIFDARLMAALRKSPVSARIILAQGFDSIPAKAVYKPLEVDVVRGLGHMILISGWGTDEKTHQRYWKAQDSFGLEQGEAGHIRVAMGDDVVTDYFDMSL